MSITASDVHHEAVEFGDQMSEFLEGLLSDDVVRAYLLKIDNLMLPFAHSPKVEDLRGEGIIAEWDEFVGKLQRARLIHIPEGDENILVESRPT